MNDTKNIITYMEILRLLFAVSTICEWFLIQVAKSVSSHLTIQDLNLGYATFPTCLDSLFRVYGLSLRTQAPILG